MNDFLPDLGTAIANNTIKLNDQLVITLTAYSLSGQPLLSRGKTVEVNHEVFGHLGTFVLPCSAGLLKQMVKVNGGVSFKIVRVSEEQTSSHGEVFRPIEVDIV